MSFLRDAQAWLNQTMAGAATATITITRGVQTSAAVQGWLGRTVFRQQPQAGAAGAQIVFGEDDLMIPVAGYVLGGVASVPARGDRFAVEEVPGVTFETFAPGGEPH